MARSPLPRSRTTSRTTDPSWELMPTMWSNSCNRQGQPSPKMIRCCSSSLSASPFPSCRPCSRCPSSATARTRFRTRTSRSCARSSATFRTTPPPCDTWSGQSRGTPSPPCSTASRLRSKSASRRQTSSSVASPCPRTTASAAWSGPAGNCSVADTGANVAVVRTRRPRRAISGTQRLPRPLKALKARPSESRVRRMHCASTSLRCGAQHLRLDLAPSTMETANLLSTSQSPRSPKEDGVDSPSARHGSFATCLASITMSAPSIPASASKSRAPSGRSSTGGAARTKRRAKPNASAGWRSRTETSTRSWKTVQMATRATKKTSKTRTIPKR